MASLAAQYPVALKWKVSRKEICWFNFCAWLRQVDVELAKSITDRGELEEDDEVKKKLWLKIARHVVEEEKDIKKAMLFLQVSSRFVVN